MEKTVRDVLVQTLENLEKKSFKKFKNKLNDWKIKEEFSRIPKGKLEEADTEDVADLIRKYYKDSYGIEVTLAALEAIDERKEAEDLRNALQTVNGFVFQTPTMGADQGATSGAPIENVAQKTTTDEEHFVDRHRAALIGRVTLVAPILDLLYENKQLTSEEYDNVRSMRTSQEQMRELFRYVNSWGKKDKDKFLETLKKLNPLLVRSLEES